MFDVLKVFITVCLSIGFVVIIVCLTPSPPAYSNANSNILAMNRIQKNQVESLEKIAGELHKIRRIMQTKGYQCQRKSRNLDPVRNENSVSHKRKLFEKE